MKSCAGVFFVLAALLCSCVQKLPQDSAARNAAQFEKILRETEASGAPLSDESRYTAVNGIAQYCLAQKDYAGLILLLTSTVERNPADVYNAYWLLMTAYAYMETDAAPFAEYYFERAVETCGDLLVGDPRNSVHFLCLQNLVKIGADSKRRVSYLTRLIDRFPQLVNKTEMYYRLASEYEQAGEWNSALKTYALFLSQSDSRTIQIAGIPDAYSRARRLVSLSSPPRNWTFDSLEALERAVKAAIDSYDYSRLDRYRARAGFFTMSWRQGEGNFNSEAEFSFRNFMLGNKIHYNEEFDAASTPNEAYLRTWGWSDYISVWYLCFRKVNFPPNPDIHGKWEWAGIYFGDRV
jgi:tetratricopeptide (TPR) repeat protein